MQEVMLALLAGGIVGFLFALIKLPIPAPPVLSGVMGIVGVYLGSKLYHWIIPFISHR
ncbi:XapX domain-containing protein [bacterium LRH843]|nr:XapX domain-containing protein [bacterium LRH843]